MSKKLLDVVVVGAGPAGLAAGLEAKKYGLDCVVLDKGGITNSILNFPTQMIFFTTPELLEIGGVPLVSDREKPTRNEALKYYRKVVGAYKLKVNQYEEVLRVEQFEPHIFRVHTPSSQYEARNVVISIGYYDNPNMMGIPGEDLPKVAHYYQEAHPYYNCDVAVIGGRNSAAEAALDLFRHGARVTLIHRSAQLSDRIKYWLRPDIENRIRAGEIQALLDTRVVEIRPDCIQVTPVHSTGEPGTVRTLKNDFVLALTGYRPDVEFIRRAGVEVEPRRLRPYCNTETLESNVPGLYLAGVIIAGLDTNEIFIENGRFHAKQIVPDMAAKL